ncbi:MAG TPA: murein L,D-transpeptidase catalytic domain family protein [Vicinamibacterales bacterium]|jgi:hypothetical protein
MHRVSIWLCLWHLTAAFVFAAASVAVCAASPASGSTDPSTRSTDESARPDASAWSEAREWKAESLGDIDPRVFDAALAAAADAVARRLAVDPATLTVIDYRRPSIEKRMWVYDLRSHALLFDELVAHGRGSGKVLATSFSNGIDSDKSSVGLFRTGETYEGHNGYSLRLDGLDPGVNDRARDRAIVIHGAWYVSSVIAKAQGYLGRSLGCPAVRPEIAHQLIDAIKGGGLVFAYGGRAS